MEPFVLKNSDKKKKHTLKSILALSATAFAIVRVALYDGLTVRNYEIQTPLVSNKHTFALVTDLHSTLYGREQSELIDAIAKYSPEAVFFSGDIADDKRDFAPTKLLLTKLSGKYPCYYVAGNHERWVEFTDDIKKLIEDCGVNVVSDKSVYIGDNIMLYGLDDPLYYSDRNFKSVISSVEIDGECYNILLSHRPEYAECYTSHGFNLTLCGHAHGGQVRLPLVLNGLYAPHQGWFPKYAGGSYNLNGGHVVVSRGLMKNDLPRVFNSPELVIVTISPK